MAEVIDINSARPHLSGPAHCIGCGEKWVAVGPIGEFCNMECPVCGALKGIRSGFVLPEALWQCKCGVEMFYIEPSGTIRCPNCGISHGVRCDG